MGRKANVIVLAGGFSEEREISIKSGKAIYDAVRRLEYKSCLIDPATGKSLLGADNTLLAEKFSGDTDLKSGYELDNLLTPDYRGEDNLVFLALHGGAGENGTIQAMLDLAGIKYTGSRQLASTVAMNKAFAKSIIKKDDIPTPAWRLLANYDKFRLDDFCDLIIKDFNFPLIVKPNDSGSTVGLTLVKKTDHLGEALSAAGEVSNEVLIEQYIKGREITAAILDDVKLPLVEIIPSGELYDYQSKYTAGGSQYICPAEIDKETKSLIQDYALKAYKLIQCSGLARVDFILAENGIPYFLEINTLPGMTELSLAPMAAQADGVSFDELISRIIDSALK